MPILGKSFTSDVTSQNHPDMELWVLLVHVGIQLYRPSPHRCPRPSASDLYRSKFSVVATPHVHSCPSLMVRFRSSMPRMLTARRLSKKSTAPLSVQTATKCLVDLGFAEPRGRSHRSGCPRSPPKKNITVQRVSKAAIKQGICYCLGWVQRVQIPSEEVLGALGDTHPPGSGEFGINMLYPRAPSTC